MEFLDISRAHPHCLPLRDNVYIEAPKELGLTQAQCILLKRAWYGTRDVGQAFEFAVAEDFEKRDFIKGYLLGLRLQAQRE